MNEKPLEVNVQRKCLSKYFTDLEMSPGWHSMPNGVAAFGDPVASVLLDPRQSIEGDMRGRLTMLKAKHGMWTACSLGTWRSEGLVHTMNPRER